MISFFLNAMVLCIWKKAFSLSLFSFLFFFLHWWKNCHNWEKKKKSAFSALYNSTTMFCYVLIRRLNMLQDVSDTIYFLYGKEMTWSIRCKLKEIMAFFTLFFLPQQITLYCPIQPKTTHKCWYQMFKEIGDSIFYKWHNCYHSKMIFIVQFGYWIFFVF